MSVILSQGIEISRQQPIDVRMGPFSTIAEAKSSVIVTRRYLGLTVIILQGEQLSEYWWRDGILDEDLIPKTVTTIGTNDAYIVISSIDVLADNVLDLSAYSDYNTFYITVGSTINIYKIIPPHAYQFIIIFASAIFQDEETIINLIHGTYQNGILDLEGINNTFNVTGTDWIILKQDILDSTKVRQLSSCSTVIPEIEGEDPNFTGMVQFVEHLPETGTDDVIYVVTSVNPHPEFRWDASLLTWIRLGEQETSSRIVTVSTVFTTNYLNLRTPIGENGVVVGSNSTALFTGQGSSLANGIYEVDSIEPTYVQWKRHSAFTLHTYKGCIFKVTNGTVYYNSLWIPSMRTYLNLGGSYYKSTGVLPALDNVPLIFSILYYSPTDVTTAVLGDLSDVLDEGIKGAILYKDEDNVWKTLGLGVVGQLLQAGVAGLPVYGAVPPYPVETLPLYAPNVYLNRHAVYKVSVPGYVSVEINLKKITAGYYATITVENTGENENNCLLLFQVFSVINGTDVIIPNGSSKINWANDIILTQIGAYERYKLYISCDGNDPERDIIISYIKLRDTNQ